jgi:hypothetical protein
MDPEEPSPGDEVIDLANPMPSAGVARRGMPNLSDTDSDEEENEEDLASGFAPKREARARAEAGRASAARRAETGKAQEQDAAGRQPDEGARGARASALTYPNP